MIENRYIELMNREIDGANSPEESAALRAHLESNEEARRYYEDLRGLSNMFAAAGDVAPPKDLNREIMRSVAEHDAVRASSGAGRAGSGAARARRAPLFGIFAGKRLAYSFAAGLALGLVILVIVMGAVTKQSRFDRSALYGALGDRRSMGSVIATETVPLETDDVSGSIDVRYLANTIVVTLELDARREIETTLRADTTSVTLTSSGRCSAAMAFRDDAGAHPDVKISITADGGRIYEGIIAGDKAGAARK
jgi:hypothetical protein